MTLNSAPSKHNDGNLISSEVSRQKAPLPVHWGLLQPQDMGTYITMQQRFYHEQGRPRRGERLESFSAQLNEIRAFVVRKDPDDWKRSLVCGIVFMTDAIAINITQLKMLLGKSKSSINGTLSLLGYSTLPQGKNVLDSFVEAVPNIHFNRNEAKKWTFRGNPKYSGVKQASVAIQRQQIEYQAVQYRQHIPIMVTKARNALENENNHRNKALCPLKFMLKYQEKLNRASQ